MKFRNVFMAFLVALTVFGYCNTLNAQTRTNISEGVTLVDYGSFQIIEDDNRQQSIRVEVKETQKKDSSTGETLYSVFCENKLVKTVVKNGIGNAIAYGLKTTGWGAAVPSWLVKAVSGAIYDKVCDHFEKKYRN